MDYRGEGKERMATILLWKKTRTLKIGRRTPVGAVSETEVQEESRRAGWEAEKKDKGSLVFPLRIGCPTESSFHQLRL